MFIANNHALEVVNTLYGAKSMSESAKYLLKVRTETLRKNIKDKRYGLAYAIEELQIEHLQRSVSENALIQQSSPMNVWLSIIHYSLGICLLLFRKRDECIMVYADYGSNRFYIDLCFI